MRLFAFGSNGSGQLGIGHEEDVSTPTQCLFEQPEQPQGSQRHTIPNISLADDSEIITIAAGGNHTLLLASNGSIYAAGCNTDGRCGPHRETKNPKEPESDINERNILRFRQMILSDTVSDTEVSKFKHVSATWEGTVAVASVSRTRGNDIGHGHSSDTEDRVFVFGSSPKGELGLGPDTPAPVPGTCIPSFPPAGLRITALASGMAHSAAVLSNGDVYGWGAARKGQLGEENRGARVAYSPVRICVPFFAEAVTCGREFTVVSGQGRFVVLGDGGNRWGILGVPESLSLRVGSNDEDRGLGEDGDYLQDDEKGDCGGRSGTIRYRYTGIGASWHGVYVHAAPGLGRVEPSTSDAQTDSDSDFVGGSIVAWGRNDRGQLPPPDLPPPAKLAVGSEHALALLGDGRVAAFGWGEHGNCGPDTDSRGNVSGTYNVISLSEAVGTDGKVVGVGAGCATSWMIVT
ncbi:Regulator of chromosome condensation, RCC1 [Penicillium expansum]|uniref:Regulator of chromosome condensation, RCC1 n=1 Tax=Penicillium expansum TaxID=27334 RepID=A0A0A2J670_PENEN|nr:Regulator of chromosome condensation, RCC1 [Penicillium expansum]KGO50829.1 Regulator of chromosome condensation, RCC1 [Penicillium expansum]